MGKKKGNYVDVYTDASGKPTATERVNENGSRTRMGMEEKKYRQTLEQTDEELDKSDKELHEGKLSEKAYEGKQKLISKMSDEAIKDIPSKNKDKYMGNLIRSGERGYKEHR